MSLTEAELTVVNQSLDRIHAAQIVYATQTSIPALTAIRNYEQTRDALLRSHEWTFASARDELAQIKTLTLDTMPTAAWSVGDTITGITSGATAEILTVTSETEYEIVYLDGDFTDGETITNADDVEIVYWEGQPLTYEGETVYSYDDSDGYQVNCGTGYPVVAAITPDFKWTYQYQLPSDYLRLIFVYEDDGIDYENERWTIEGNRILTHYDTVHIKYVKKVTDPTAFDPLFTELLILRLALKLFYALASTASAKSIAELKDEIKDANSRAKIVSSQENDTTGRSDFLLSRYGS